MVQINFALKEVNCKIVFYGPGMSGKTTNLEIVHQKAPEENKGELTSISTDGDRTLFFDFMPLDLGNVAGMRTKFQLYTVPGQVYYNSTRKLVLQGVDGVIFVADSDPDQMPENIESYENLIENLREYGKDATELPHVLQYNKRDLPNALSVEEMDAQLNKFGVPTFEAVAKTGEGVFPTLKVLAGLVLESIDRMDNRRASKPVPKPQAAEATAPAPALDPVPAPAASQQAAAQASGAEAPARRPQHQQRRTAAAKPRGGASGGAKASGGQRAPRSRGAGTSGKRQRGSAAAGQRSGGSRRSQGQGRGRRGADSGGSKAKSGVAVAVVATMFLAAAVAGAVFFFMQNQG